MINAECKPGDNLPTWEGISGVNAEVQVHQTCTKPDQVDVLFYIFIFCIVLERYFCRAKGQWRTLPIAVTVFHRPEASEWRGSWTVYACWWVQVGYLHKERDLMQLDISRGCFCLIKWRSCVLHWPKRTSAKSIHQWTATFIVITHIITNVLCVCYCPLCNAVGLSFLWLQSDYKKVECERTLFCSVKQFPSMWQCRFLPYFSPESWVNAGFYFWHLWQEVTSDRELSSSKYCLDALMKESKGRGAFWVFHFGPPL